MDYSSKERQPLLDNHAEVEIIISEDFDDDEHHSNPFKRRVKVPRKSSELMGNLDKSLENQSKLSKRTSQFVLIRIIWWVIVIGIFLTSVAIFATIAVFIDKEVNEFPAWLEGVIASVVSLIATIIIFMLIIYIIGPKQKHKGVTLVQRDYTSYFKDELKKLTKIRKDLEEREGREEYNKFNNNNNNNNEEDTEKLRLYKNLPINTDKNIHEKNFNCLSLDGGGIKGVFTARILERIIERYPNFLDKIDCIAGTSTGAILALCLSRGFSVSSMLDFYKIGGPIIFADNYVDNAFDITNLLGAQYDTEGRLLALKALLQDDKLSDLKKIVLIPAVDVFDVNYLFQVKIFNNVIYHHSNDGVSDEKFDTYLHNIDDNDNEFNSQPFKRIGKTSFISNDLNRSCVDVAMASSAAPTYFPIYKGYVDGGVYANNPSEAGCITAIKLGYDIKHINIISISTGTDIQSFVPKNKKINPDLGILQWAPHLLDLMFQTSSNYCDWIVGGLLESRYLRIETDLPVPVALDDVGFIQGLIDIANEVDLTDTFKYIEKRFNFDD